jgi:hypothetical protein
MMENFWIWYLALGIMPCISLAKGFLSEQPMRYKSSVILYFGICMIVWPLILLVEWLKKLKKKS